MSTIHVHTAQPSGGLLAAEILDVLTAGPSTASDLAHATGAPVDMVRWALSALWTSDRVAPAGDNAWALLTDPFADRGDL